MTRREANSGTGRAKRQHAEKPALCGKTASLLTPKLRLGTALRSAREQHGVELLREMEREWPYFAALISNAEMACVKADLDIARRYAELCVSEEIRHRIWGTIEEEFERTVREIGAVRVSQIEKKGKQNRRVRLVRLAEHRTGPATSNQQRYVAASASAPISVSVR